MNKKIYISQPMLNKTNEQIIKRREKIKQYVIDMLGPDVEFIDSFFKDAPHEAKPLWYLGKALQKLSEADFAVFDKGWELARGCRIEHECALQYGIGIFNVRDDYGD